MRGVADLTDYVSGSVRKPLGIDELLYQRARNKMVTRTSWIGDHNHDEGF